MPSLTDALGVTVSAVTAMGALGTAAFGLVDATKAFWGGVSNFGFGDVERALQPFRPSLDNASPVWRATVRANWINGVPKDQQKTAARSLIRLGLSAANAQALATVACVDAAKLQTAMQRVEASAGGATPSLQPEDAIVLGRFNAAIDAAMDAGFERADQKYRNASRLTAGLFAVGLSVWAGQLLAAGPTIAGLTPSNVLWPSILVGLLAVPIAPIAKDLASSLQAAAAAVGSIKR